MGMDTLSRETTLSNCFVSLLKKIYSKRKESGANYFPLEEHFMLDSLLNYSRVVQAWIPLESEISFLLYAASLHKAFPLQKHASSNILKILPPKIENFQIKNSDICHISVQNIEYGYSLEPPRWGGSNEHP